MCCIESATERPLIQMALGANSNRIVHTYTVWVPVENSRTDLPSSATVSSIRLGIPSFQAISFLRPLRCPCNYLRKIPLGLCFVRTMPSCGLSGIGWRSRTVPVLWNRRLRGCMPPLVRLSINGSPMSGPSLARARKRRCLRDRKRKILLPEYGRVRSDPY